jgi:hypothetical protein
MLVLKLVQGISLYSTPTSDMDFFTLPSREVQ